MTTGSPQLREFQLVDAAGAPSIRRIAAYWDQLRGAAFAPPRHAIDPAAITRDLPYLFMLDVLGGGADYRYRLVGTEVVAFSGRDVTGKTFGELYGDQPAVLERAITTFGTVLATRRPAYARGQVYWLADRQYRAFEAGYFPLSRDGAGIDIILCAMSFEPPAPVP